MQLWRISGPVRQNWGETHVVPESPTSLNFSGIARRLRPSETHTRKEYQVMQILLISSTQFADSTGVDMYYICAQRVVAAAANAPDATPRSASDFISCTSALE